MHQWNIETVNVRDVRVVLSKPHSRKAAIAELVVYTVPAILVRVTKLDWVISTMPIPFEVFLFKEEVGRAVIDRIHVIHDEIGDVIEKQDWKERPRKVEVSNGGTLQRKLFYCKFYVYGAAICTFAVRRR